LILFYGELVIAGGYCSQYWGGEVVACFSKMKEWI
jgi:hypothetical protein